MRRDCPKAVEALAELLNETETAEAAARALGNIGNASAAKALEEALPEASGRKQLAICEGLFRCAETLGAEGQGQPSQAIYDRVRGLAGAPPQIRAAALRGAILARGKDGVPLLVEAVSGSDYAMAAAAVRRRHGIVRPRNCRRTIGRTTQGARPAAGPAHYRPGRSWRAPEVLPTVLEAAQSSDEQLRILAFRALKRVGDASCVPSLLDAAAQGSNEVSQAAIASLESLQDKSVDDQLVKRLSDAQGKMRTVLIELVGRRRTAAATPALWLAAEDSDAAVRVAALTALGAVTETTDLPKLVARLATTKSDQETAALDKALRDVCLRSEDREAVTAQLAAALPEADGPVKARILDTLNAVGGETSLKTVAAAARSDDSELRDAAFRVLGQWKSADAAPVLLELHNAVNDDRLKIRAIRAYIRIARQFDMPENQRAAMCRTALEAAQRDADKRLVLEVLLRYPSEEMQAIAKKAAENPALKEQALLIVMGMASQGINRAELGKALAQAGQTPVKLEIVKAEYGVGDKIKDVTAILRKHAKSYRIIFLPSTSYNQSFGGDPASGIAKKLKIKYRIDGKDGEVSLNENATIVLPMPK